MLNMKSHSLGFKKQMMLKSGHLVTDQMHTRTKLGFSLSHFHGGSDLSG